MTIGRIALLFCAAIWCACGAFALAALVGRARRAMRRYGVSARVVFLLAAAACVMLAGGKSGSVSVHDDYIQDAGSYLTNDVAHVALSKKTPILPDSTEILVYARELSSTNAADWFRLSPHLTYADHPHDYALPNATNYSVLVSSSFVPEPTVHTNGIWALRGFEVPGHPGKYAFGNSRVRKIVTASAYVQDGLIAMWDGIENAGWGVHDPSAPVWKDLIGSKDITIVGGVFGDTALVCNGLQYGGYYESVVNGVQVELVANAKQQKRRCWIASTGQSLSNKYSGFIGWYDRGLCFGLYDTAKSLTLGTAVSYSFVINSSNTYENNTLVATESGKSDLTPQAQRGICVVVGGQINNPLMCDIHCFRIYSRALTAEEIEHNYKIDRIRFNLP